VTSETASRLLYWVQPAIGALALAYSIFFFVYIETGSFALHIGVGAFLTAAVIAPALVLSTVINHALLHRRPKPRMLSVAEAILVMVQAVLTALLVWQAFDQWSLVALLLAPLMLGTGIATMVLLARRAKSTAVVVATS
jgi:uncharacterized membrane protein YhaH (DUF805 family)